MPPYSRVPKGYKLQFRTQLIVSREKAESWKLPRKTLPKHFVRSRIFFKKIIKACHWYPDCCLRPNSSSLDVKIPVKPVLLHLPRVCPPFYPHTPTDTKGQSVLLIHRPLITGFVHPGGSFGVGEKKKDPCSEIALERRESQQKRNRGPNR